MRDQGNTKQVMVSRRKCLEKLEIQVFKKWAWLVGEQTSFIHFFEGRKFPCHGLEDDNVLRTSIEAGVSHSSPIHIMVTQSRNDGRSLDRGR